MEDLLMNKAPWNYKQKAWLYTVFFIWSNLRAFSLDSQRGAVLHQKWRGREILNYANNKQFKRAVKLSAQFISQWCSPMVGIFTWYGEKQQFLKFVMWWLQYEVTGAAGKARILGSNAGQPSKTALQYKELQNRGQQFGLVCKNIRVL